MPEIIGDAGVLVRPGDEPALRAALNRLLNNDGRRTQLSVRARRRAYAMTWDGVAQSVEHVLQLKAVAA
jgi:glycosyltransferase involved in cell wall biosynthesis